MVRRFSDIGLIVLHQRRRNTPPASIHMYGKFYRICAGFHTQDDLRNSGRLFGGLFEQQIIQNCNMPAFVEYNAAEGAIILLSRFEGAKGKLEVLPATAKEPL
jgi:hypothetical protein